MSTPSAPAGGHRPFSERLPSLAEVGPLIALVLACAFFISQSNRFLSFQNLSLILQQTMVVAVIAIGQTLIVLTGGIDLSCGMVMAFGSIIMTKFAVNLGVPPVLAIVCGIGASALFGARCAASDNCWAVGLKEPMSGSVTNEILRWNGTRWSDWS